LHKTGGILRLRINLLAVVGALVGIISVFQTWITSDEILKIRANSGSMTGLPARVVPDLNLIGICDTGWIFSSDLGFTVAAFLFFAGTILAFYTSLGGLVQVAGFVTFYRVFDSAQGAVVSGLPSGMGPKVALISMIIVLTGLVFPIFVWSKAKLKSIWRRFLTVTPEQNVKQTMPLVYAAAGSASLLWGQVVATSSAYEEGTLSAALFTVAGLIAMAVGMFALIIAWKAD
jgi:hypothetical protein